MDTKISSTNFIYDTNEDLTGVNVTFTCQGSSDYISGTILLTPEEVDKYGIRGMKKAVEAKLSEIFSAKVVA